ncbi:MAG: hypothetical protein QMD10_11850 [Desulfitobacteriaceae bacterium]|nr:hypothetical protein [Desulfitobacteriaceae bacterium]
MGWFFLYWLAAVCLAFFAKPSYLLLLPTVRRRALSVPSGRAPLLSFLVVGLAQESLGLPQRGKAFAAPLWLLSFGGSWFGIQTFKLYCIPGFWAFLAVAALVFVSFSYVDAKLQIRAATQEDTGERPLSQALVGVIFPGIPRVRSVPSGASKAVSFLFWPAFGAWTVNSLVLSLGDTRVRNLWDYFYDSGLNYLKRGTEVLLLVWMTLWVLSFVYALWFLKRNQDA